MLSITAKGLLILLSNATIVIYFSPVYSICKENLAAAMQRLADYVTDRDISLEVDNEATVTRSEVQVIAYK